jgi:hypothetical protein
LKKRKKPSIYHPLLSGVLFAASIILKPKLFDKIEEEKNNQSSSLKSLIGW